MHAKAADRLLHYYSKAARDLPWRAPPGAPRQDPYRVWLSEVMLQQTTVATVTPRYRRFLERWPTVEALAAASDEDILGEWAGLGYYARARNLIACARAVAARGGFPASEAELRQLPGLGAYTAAAVAAIAFGEDAVPIDTNVERVVARVFGLADRGAVAEAARDWWPTGRAGDFAQACMDLGATICRPRQPLCDRCPLQPDCRAAALGRPEDIPARKAKKDRPHRFGLAWWIRRDDALWLTRRPATGLLGGMAALPGPEWSEARPAANPLAVHRHGFTHFTLDLLVVPRGEPEGDGWWQPLATLAEAGLPTLYRRAVEAALAAEREPRLAA
ncbi:MULTISPECIES: A/G-specific adenine glycosylase [Sphingomonas]|uniref:A/G-specific adenine glycosylase n=1 Tax=Sphingomonas TaxID=13687 RepID=UPI000DEF8D08|nr:MULTISPECIES: A/G-specific adenine glycosylase [Sphingomonas]